MWKHSIQGCFHGVQKRLTLEGIIVISVGLFGHSGDDEVWTESTKEMLDDMHKRKIDMADEIFVINVGGYIGSSTRSEIENATATGKPVILATHNDCRRQEFSVTAYTAAKNAYRQLISFASIDIWSR